MVLSVGWAGQRSFSQGSRTLSELGGKWRRALHFHCSINQPGVRSPCAFIIYEGNLGMRQEHWEIAEGAKGEK